MENRINFVASAVKVSEANSQGESTWYKLDEIIVTKMTAMLTLRIF